MGKCSMWQKVDKWQGKEEKKKTREMNGPEMFGKLSAGHPCFITHTLVRAKQIRILKPSAIWPLGSLTMSWSQYAVLALVS